MFFPQIVKLSDSLLADQDDMVQKGLGWLLRETAKYDAKRTIPYLMKIRARCSSTRVADRVRDPARSGRETSHELLTAKHSTCSLRNNSATHRCAAA